MERNCMMHRVTRLPLSTAHCARPDHRSWLIPNRIRASIELAMIGWPAQGGRRPTKLVDFHPAFRVLVRSPLGLAKPKLARTAARLRFRLRRGSLARFASEGCSRTCAGVRG